MNSSLREDGKITSWKSDIPVYLLQKNKNEMHIIRFGISLPGNLNILKNTKEVERNVLCFSNLYHTGPTIIFRLVNITYLANLELVPSSVMLSDYYAAVLYIPTQVYFTRRFRKRKTYFHNFLKLYSPHMQHTILLHMNGRLSWKLDSNYITFW